MAMPDVSHIDLPVRPWSDQDEEAFSDSFGGPISLTQNDSFVDPISVTQHDSHIYRLQSVETGGPAMHSMGLPAMAAGCTDNITEKVKTVRSTGRRRRLRISLPSFLCGLLCIAIATPLFFSLRKSGSHGDMVLLSFTYCLEGVGLLSFLISLLPSDRRAVPCTGFIIATFFLATNSVSLARLISNISDYLEAGCIADMWDKERFEGTGEEMDTGACFATWILFAGEFCIVHLSIWGTIFLSYRRLCTLRRSESHAMLRVIWFNVRWMASAIASFSTLRAFVALLFPRYIYFLEEVVVNIPFLLLAIVSHPRLALRSRVQSWLASFGEGTAVAAGVAELLGNVDIETLISKAKNSLFYISADVLTKEDMAQNTPNPALSRFVRKGTLGRIDAFVSHSWRDDADAKWHALQRWITDFKEKRGRAPTLWIDKYCIDQTNIDDSLMCLPIYLSGCRQMLVLCGETYLQRLWCLVEIFVFSTMLGQDAMTEVRYLNVGSNDDSQPLGSLNKALERFDSGSAVCTNVYDTHRLRAVMEASDIGKDGMAELVKSVFDSGRPSVRFSLMQTT